MSDGTVTFTYKDYKDGGRRKILTLQGEEFLRRFLLHVLPKGFVRIRHFGLCASANVHTKLARAQQLLAPAPVAAALAPPPVPDVPLSWSDRFLKLTGIDVMACPSCGARLVRREPGLLEVTLAETAPAARARAPPRLVA